MFNCLLLFVIIYNVGARAQNCYMPSGQLGLCVFREECPVVMNNFLSSARTDENSIQRALEFLNALERACDIGMQSKICCNQPDDSTPPDVTRHRNLQLLENSCGLFSGNKITGGENTGLFEFPWMALLGLQNLITGNIEFVCGGTIINRRYILTAAHCVTIDPNYYALREVRVGDHDTNTVNDCETFYNGKIKDYQTVCTEGFQSFGVEQVVFHSDYSANSFQNDIAILRLNRNIEFNLRNVQPICLPIGAAGVLLNQKGIVTGWGRTKFNPVSTKLLKVEIPIVSNSDCNRYFNYLTYKQICAGGQEGLDSCTGDSGGPLQNIGNYSNLLRVVQYGIISYGPRQCGMNMVPSVYTSVLYYTNWILDNMRD